MGEYDFGRMIVTEVLPGPGPDGAARRRAWQQSPRPLPQVIQWPGSAVYVLDQLIVRAAGPRGAGGPGRGRALKKSIHGPAPRQEKKFDVSKWIKVDEK